MNVSTEDIKNIKAGTIKPFICKDALAMNSASTLVTRVKRVGMPEGVKDYETQKFYETNIILIHALAEEDGYVLNR